MTLDFDNTIADIEKHTQQLIVEYVMKKALKKN